MQTREKSIPSRGNSSCNDPRLRMSLACAKNQKKDKCLCWIGRNERKLVRSQGIEQWVNMGYGKEYVCRVRGQYISNCGEW